MIKIVKRDGSATFVNTAWIEALNLIFVKAEGAHFTRVTMHKGSAYHSIDTNEDADALAARINLMRADVIPTLSD